MDDSKKAKARKTPAPVVKKHRLLKALVAFGLLATAIIAALPWLIGTPPGRALIVGQINARLAPGSVQLDGLGLSWNGPITMDGVTLVDPKGKTVLAARRVTIDRSVLRLIASRPNYGTITVEGVAIDVERKADGSIDLLDALGPVMKPEAPAQAQVKPAPAPAPGPEPSPSKMAVTVVIKGGTLKVASPELVEPLTAGTLDGSIVIAPGKPMEVAATLGDEGRSIEVRSTVDQGRSGGLALSFVGKDWPIHVRQSGVEAKGRLVANFEAKQDQGFWSAKGDASIVGLEADGPSLLGDRLKLDRVAAACEVGQSSTGWVIRKLDLTSPVATLQGSGTIPAIAGTPTQLRGKVDLAALARMLPNAMRLRDGLTLDQGVATLEVDLTNLDGNDRAELIVSLDDFAATEKGRAIGLRKPVYLNGRATRIKQKVTVETLEVKAAGIDVTAGGDLEAGVKLSGTVDLVALSAQLRDILDLGALDFSGHARLAADYRHAGDSFKGRLAAELKDLKVVGLTAEPITRDLVRLDASASGPSQPDGLPSDWQQARLDLKAGDLKLDLIADATAGNADLVAGFEMMVASPVPGRLDAKAKFRKKGTAFEVDELSAGITPTDPQAASSVVALAVRGTFDTASGVGTFGAIPGYAVGAVGLGPEGAKVSGLGRPGEPLKIEAALIGELATLDRLLAGWSGSPLKGLGGLWATQVTVGRSAAGKFEVEGKVYAPDVVVTTSKGPISAVLKGSYAPDDDRLDLATLDLGSKFGRLTLAGNLLEATKGRKLMDLTGTLEPNWGTIDPMIVSSVEPNARVRATVRPIHLAGMLKADTTPQLLNQIGGEVAVDLTMAEAFGVKLGTTALVLKLGNGRAVFDPIRTTMNDGPVSIAAELALDGDNGVWLRLGASRVDGAAINEAVSNSLLAYVAPVLAKSSEVTGKVTVSIDQGLIPITATRPMALDGAIAFQNVVFKPGPLADQLTSITGRPSADLKLDEAMLVKIANGRVQQNGLVIPLGGNGLKVAIDGSVGFDETLDLKATVPISAKTLGLGASAGQLAGGTTVALPIRGTLAKPAIDRDALRLALRDAAKGMGEKELKSEAGRLLERIAGPNQPAGEPRSKPARRNPLGDLENLGREILDPKKP